MQKVDVRGADGVSKELAFVRRTGRTIYVCPIRRFKEVAAGDETYVVGFPEADVKPLTGEALPN
jgi:hypothetical protein